MMKPSLLLALALLAAACDAFKPAALRAPPRARTAFRTRRAVAMSDDDEPSLKFNTPAGIEDAPVVDPVELEQEDAAAAAAAEEEKIANLRPEEELTDAEIRDRQRMLAIKKYAPWMADMASPEAIAARESAERERKAKKAEKLVGNKIDPAKQEVSGAGLKIRVKSGDPTSDVELAWSTGEEEGNLGFVVARKQEGQGDFKALASYEQFQSLRSKGPQGGSYSFVDEGVSPGAYIYKVQDVATGSKFVTDVCQKGVEVLSKSEQSNNLAVVAGFGVVALALVAVGVVLDPQ